MITLQYHDGGVQRSLDLAVDSLRDLNPIFKKYIAWLKPEIDKVFQAQGPGWAPLAQGTKEAREAAMPALAKKIREGSLNTLSRKLGREERKVTRRLDKRRADQGSYEWGSRKAKLLGSAERAAERQRRIRAEFQRIAGGGERDDKTHRKLYERIGRAEGRAEDKIAKLQTGELLGQIANSIGWEIKEGGLEVFSRITWAGAHNEGATVGRGARLPERRFLQWTPERIAMLAKIAEETIVAKVKK